MKLLQNHPRSLLPLIRTLPPLPPPKNQTNPTPLYRKCDLLAILSSSLSTGRSFAPHCRVESRSGRPTPSTLGFSVLDLLLQLEAKLALEELELGQEQEVVVEQKPHSVTSSPSLPYPTFPRNRRHLLYSAIISRIPSYFTWLDWLGAGTSVFTLTFYVTLHLFSVFQWPTPQYPSYFLAFFYYASLGRHSSSDPSIHRSFYSVRHSLPWSTPDLLPYHGRYIPMACGS